MYTDRIEPKRLIILGRFYQFDRNLDRLGKSESYQSTVSLRMVCGHDSGAQFYLLVFDGAEPTVSPPPGLGLY